MSPHEEDPFVPFRAAEDGLALCSRENAPDPLSTVYVRAERQAPWNRHSASQPDCIRDVEEDSVSFLSAVDDGLQIVLEVGQSGVINAPRSSALIQILVDLARRGALEA